MTVSPRQRRGRAAGTQGLDLRDGGMRTVAGSAYRVGSRELASGERLVSAVSLDQANKTVLARETVIVIVLVLLALLGTAARHR